MFYISDMYWRDYKKPSHIKAIEVLNSLSEEQKKAVELYASSRRESGFEDGYDIAYRENSD